jgi:hypothetical protein
MVAAYCGYYLLSHDADTGCGDFVEFKVSIVFFKWTQCRALEQALHIHVSPKNIWLMLKNVERNCVGSFQVFMHAPKTFDLILNAFFG